jgi:hypothetical protein
MVEKLTVGEFSKSVGSDVHLLARASFENRSQTVSLANPKWASATLFASKVRSAEANQHLSALTGHLNDAHFPVVIEVHNPISMATALKSGFERFSSIAENKAAIVDVTSFRREELLVLLSLIKHSKAYSGWRLAYTGAQHMGEWLSGKVIEHRSVIGFPGDIRPSRSTTLVMLMGFEVARARSIIEAYEPKELVLGMGRQAESISDELYARNLQLFNELVQEFKSSVKSKFEFSAREPVKVKRELGEIMEGRFDANIVIAPLHTKLSTIGAGLYALDRHEVQICYAAVEEYNEAAYSAPGASVYLIPVSTLFSS